MSRSARLLLVLLLAADGGFLLLHIAHTYTSYLADGRYSLNRDRGFAETYEYVQELWVVLLVVALAWRPPLHWLGAWVVPFGYALVDDAFRVHERVGALLSGHFGWGPHFELRAQDFGELTTTAVAGTVAAVAVGMAWWRGGEPVRWRSRRLLLLVGLLAFFGVGCDMAEVALGHLGLEGVATAMGGIEDAGEMAVMSLIVAWCFDQKLASSSMAERIVPTWGRITSSSSGA